MKTYLNLAVGAKTRLQSLKNIAKKYGKAWRDCRFDNFKSSGNNQGFNGKEPIWCFMSHDITVRKVIQADAGYYCDTYQDNQASGVIGMLSHGRFIAGYSLSDNDETVFFTEIFDNAEDAVRMSDEHARVIADQEFEHNQMFNDAQNLADSIEDDKHRLRECIILRNEKGMVYVRHEMSNLIERIRDSRKTLKTNYTVVL